MKEHHGGKRDEYTWSVRVRAEAHLDAWINDYFDGLTVRHELDGTTSLTGRLPDLPAVYGIVLKLRDTGVELLTLNIERETG